VEPFLSKERHHVHGLAQSWLSDVGNGRSGLAGVGAQGLEHHAELIDNTPAAVTVHWRYLASFTAGNPHGNVTPENLVDEWFTITPDGRVNRVIKQGTAKADAWNDPLNRTIQTLQLTAVGVAEISRELPQHTRSQTKAAGNPELGPVVGGPSLWFSFDEGLGDDTTANPAKSRKYHPFAIQDFDGGDIYGGERTWYSVFPSWNHWPTAQANSSGRNASFPDRAAHSSISHLSWPQIFQQKGDVSYQEKLLMEGMTDQPPAVLANLAKSWLDAPPVTDLTAGAGQGYIQARRTYGFDWGAAPLRFELAASAAKPIHNLCFEIRNWKSRTATAALKINQVSQAAGPDFRQGVNIDHDGTYTLLVWIGLSATTPQEFELIGGHS
jgi:hypothetical protein